MAKMNWGILDGFFGKVGTVVGSFWKSIPVMRAYKRVVRNPKTESQQLVLEEHSLSASRRSALNKAKVTQFKRDVPNGASLFLFLCLAKMN